jgi:hypothetical protein
MEKVQRLGLALLLDPTEQVFSPEDRSIATSGKLVVSF